MADMVGRNQHCPCKSGKKYKRCCGSRIDNLLPAPPLATVSGTQPPPGQQRQGIEQLLTAYKERPSHLLLNQLMGRTTARELIDQLLSISGEISSPIHFQRLAMLFLNEERFMEAAYFCRCWCKHESSVESLRLLGIIALHQNDLLTINEVYGKLLQNQAPKHILQMVLSAGFFCARRLSEASSLAKEALRHSVRDPFLPMLALHIAYHAEDMALFCEIITKTKISSEVNPESHLWRRLEKHLQKHFLKMLHERSSRYE